ncbi:MAG TPA: VWA domain-containing protein [Anaerolineae bacterium]|nr:VWA domain-containing protein [Anaerolineae bacterium]
MQFLWSPLLWSVLLVPILLGVYVWMQRRRRKYALRYASLSLVKPALDNRARWRRYVPPALFFLALTVMLIAFARPVALVRTPRQEGIVILALDSSISMRAEDMKPNRFEAARAAARAFIEKRGTGAQIGIVTFAANAAIVQMPTDDPEALNSAIDTLFLQRGTAVGSGILTSMDAIALATRGVPAAKSIDPSATPEPVPTLPPVPEGTVIPAIVILLTDGQNRNGPDPIEAAQTAAQAGVRVYTVGIGSREGGTIPGGQGNGGFGNGFGRGFGGGGFRAELDEETLRAIADTTGGKYYYAANETELEKIYANMGLNIVLKLEKVELTAWFTAVAALLLFTAVVLSMIWGAVN